MIDQGQLQYACDMAAIKGAALGALLVLVMASLGVGFAEWTGWLGGHRKGQ